jgi:multidrug efflux pump subunit AcrA (membrane-fusion protein)
MVREVLVEIGDRVEQGQPLVALDTFSIEQELEMAQKLLEIAKSELARAEREYEYANWENEIKSAFKPETFDDRPLGEVEFRRAELEVHLAEHAVEITKATIAREEANIAQLEEKLANATIRAPSAGIVGACYLEPGATVGRGTPIVRLISVELWVRFAVEEQDVARIEVGAPVTVALDALGSKVTGTIEHLAPEVDPALGLMIVEAELESDDQSTAKLKPGMVARVYLGETTSADAAEPPPGP